MKYWFVTYITRDGEHEYSEAGCLSAGTLNEAEKKAMKAKRLLDRYGWEEFCEYESAMEITKEEYRVLKRFTCDIDGYFGKTGELRI